MSEALWFAVMVMSWVPFTHAISNDSGSVVLFMAAVMTVVVFSQ